VKTRLWSFDGTEQCSSDFEEPDRYSSLFRAFTDDRGAAVRGGGLSYCLASAAEGGKTVSTKHFDRILDFDAERRLVTVEPGLTVGALNDFVVARGCYFPVLPGHPSITVGGCAGFNVHGTTWGTSPIMWWRSRSSIRIAASSGAETVATVTYSTSRSGAWV
jgi:hypothetical protein